MSAESVKSGAIFADALYYVAPHKVEIRRVDVPFVTEKGKEPLALVKTLWTGLSRGTERLIFEGLVPPSEYQRMRAPFQDGDFPFPVKYGYMAVGIVEDGPADLIGKHVFALHPHQTRFAVLASSLTVLPSYMPPKRGILAAQMETALNAIWDSGIAPGDRAAVVGAGAIGLMIVSIASRIPGVEITVADVNILRKMNAETFGAKFVSPDEIEGLDADVVFHTSATSAGLAASLSAAGFEARVIEVSWYGAKEIIAPLGGAFHSKRLKLISSQVGSVAECRRARWSHGRRLEMALNLLQDECLDQLITDEVAFRDLPEQIAHIFDASAASIVTAVQY